MKKFTCGIIWIDGGSREQECSDRATARTYIESLERTRPNRQVPQIYVATRVGVGPEPGRYKIFVQVDDTGWKRDFNFEREIYYHEQKSLAAKLQKERLEALEMSQQIVGHSHPKVYSGAKAKATINGKEVEFGNGEFSYQLSHGDNKVEEYVPAGPIEVEFTVQLKSAAPSDEDIEIFLMQFFEDDAEIKKLVKALQGPDQLVGGSPLQIEALDFPPLEVHTLKKDTSDQEIDELNKSVGLHREFNGTKIYKPGKY